MNGGAWERRRLNEIERLNETLSQEQKEYKRNAMRRALSQPGSVL